ncbi:hypothetical protein B0T16DRAFT_45142 [Cercophora newfieldiana]|uniref:F-box domain-containing protein n=1 Tax=Cercophora newfieldiana TaxID=92897 RepID=A0AA39YQF6_9PEZI|nr:hypothetical protein B0T16DRAFT_45142 [Cercophora newfieldiana]
MDVDDATLSRISRGISDLIRRLPEVSLERQWWYGAHPDDYALEPAEHQNSLAATGTTLSTMDATKQVNTRPSPPSDLPPELLLTILDYLDYPAAIKAQAVCRTFYHMISLETRFTRDDRRELMLRAEQKFQRYQHPQAMFACFKCFRFLPMSGFGVSQVSGDRGKHQVYAGRRFCLRCGVSRWHYRPGQIVKLFLDGDIRDKVQLRICSTCKKPNLHVFSFHGVGGEWDGMEGCESSCAGYIAPAE